MMNVRLNLTMEDLGQLFLKTAHNAVVMNWRDQIGPKIVYPYLNGHITVAVIVYQTVINWNYSKEKEIYSFKILISKAK